MINRWRRGWINHVAYPVLDRGWDSTWGSVTRGGRGGELSTLTQMKRWAAVSLWEVLLQLLMPNSNLIVIWESILGIQKGTNGHGLSGSWGRDIAIIEWTWGMVHIMVVSGTLRTSIVVSNLGRALKWWLVVVFGGPRTQCIWPWWLVHRGWGRGFSMLDGEARRVRSRGWGGWWMRDGVWWRGVWSAKVLLWLSFEQASTEVGHCSSSLYRRKWSAGVLWGWESRLPGLPHS